MQKSLYKAGFLPISRPAFFLPSASRSDQSRPLATHLPPSLFLRSSDLQDPLIHTLFSTLLYLPSQANKPIIKMGNCCGKEKHQKDDTPAPRPVKNLPKGISSSYPGITEYRTPNRAHCTEFQKVHPDNWTPFYATRHTMSGNLVAYDFDAGTEPFLDRICDMVTPEPSVAKPKKRRRFEEGRSSNAWPGWQSNSWNGYRSEDYETIWYGSSTAS